MWREFCKFFIPAGSIWFVLIPNKCDEGITIFTSCLPVNAQKSTHPPPPPPEQGRIQDFIGGAKGYMPARTSGGGGGVLRFGSDGGVPLKPPNQYLSLRVILPEKGTYY